MRQLAILLADCLSLWLWLWCASEGRSEHDEGCSGEHCKIEKCVKEHSSLRSDDCVRRERSLSEPRAA